jgi:hypothetical protein
MFVFLRFLIKKKVKFKLISLNKTIYSAEIFFKKKKIRLRCSYRLTMLSLKELAILADVESKGVFPYSVLNKKIQNNLTIEKEMFNSLLEFEEFTKKYGTQVKIFDILEKYCKNDANITKKSIIKY